MEIFNRKFELNTLFKKGLPPIDDRFGVYFICGRQGSGKNYYAVKLALAQDRHTCAALKTNIKSLKLPGYKMEYFDKIEELYYDIDEYKIYIIDEMNRKYDKNSRTDTQFYAWLNQCRKRKRIAIMITQEWRELPMWIRRPAKYMISTQRTILSRFGIYRTLIGDAENLVFNKDEGEYECPTIKIIYYKRNLEIAQLYDTFEPINQL